MNNNLEKFKKAMSEGTVLKGKVLMVYFDQKAGEDILSMDYQGTRRVIRRRDIDTEKTQINLFNFVGRTIDYMVIEIDEESETVFCSRKLAQEKMAPYVIENLKNGEEFNAVISGFISYGAFMDVNGVYAILKNRDFSTNFAKLNDTHQVGDTIRVRLKKVSDNGRLELEAVEKYEAPQNFDIESFESGQIVLGKVNTVHPWGAYVTVVPGLDALCNIPETGEIEAGTSVTLRITKVFIEEKKIRGRILRIIQ